MKIPLLVILFLSARLVVSAQSGFFGNPPNGSQFPGGDDPGVGIQPNPNNNNDGITLSYGIAIGFTPLQTFSLINVTLWLSGYTGANDMSITCYIANDQRDNPYPNGIGASAPLSPEYPEFNIAQLSSPAPNNGSLAAFTFSGNVTLYANLVYYIYLTGNDSGEAPFGVGFAASNVPSSGNAIYNGTENWAFDIGGNLADSGLNTSYSPAFVINEVPEPSVLQLLTLGLILPLILRHRSWRAVISATKSASSFKSCATRAF